MKPIIYAAGSFRGATEGGEPGIHGPRLVVTDSGLAAFAAPRNDAEYDSDLELIPLAELRIAEV
jgi:hypothetical protein